MKLTDTKVRSAKAGKKATRSPDGHGLYLLVTLAGGKLWRWKYRYSGQEKLMSLGKYPDVSLADVICKKLNPTVEAFPEMRVSEPRQLPCAPSST